VKFRTLLVAMGVALATFLSTSPALAATEKPVTPSAAKSVFPIVPFSGSCSSKGFKMKVTGTQQLVYTTRFWLVVKPSISTKFLGLNAPSDSVASIAENGRLVDVVFLHDPIATSVWSGKLAIPWKGVYYRYVLLVATQFRTVFRGLPAATSCETSIVLRS
jgi:hypothetical protein